MTPPERRRIPLLGVAAYLLVPGERRRRAAGHFRRAGFETLLGLRALGNVGEDEPSGEAGRSGRRERIEIE